MNKNILITIIIALIIGTISFYGGMKYQENKKTTFSRGMGQRTNTTNRIGFRPVNGEILSTDEKSITVKLQDGSSKIVLFSQKMTLNKASQATITDLKTGEKVAVFGTENSDGSVTAQNIQLNPIQRQQLPN